MIVRDLMTPNPITIHEDARIVDAIILLFARGFRHLPVVDDEGRLLGMVTDRDLRPYSHHLRVEDETPEMLKKITRPVGGVIAREPLITSPDAPLSEAIGVLVDKKVGGLPVVEPDTGVLCGILTSQDVLQAIVDGNLLQEGEGSDA